MKIGILGCAGRMGQTLVREVVKTKGCELSGGTEEPNNPALGEDVASYAGLPACGYRISGDPEKIKKIYDTWVFSRDTKSKNPNWQLINTLN